MIDVNVLTRKYKAINCFFVGGLLAKFFAETPSCDMFLPILADFTESYFRKTYISMFRGPFLEYLIFFFFFGISRNCGLSHDELGISKAMSNSVSSPRITEY